MEELNRGLNDGESQGTEIPKDCEGGDVGQSDKDANHRGRGKEINLGSAFGFCDARLQLFKTYLIRRTPMFI